MTVALLAGGRDELKLAAPGTSRDSMLAEFFGDKAGEVAGMLARADASGGDDPSVDHEAKVRRFRDLAGDSGFMRGQLPQQGTVSRSMAYGANVTHRPLGPAARHAAQLREHQR